MAGLPRMSRPATAMATDYDVVVIGSGYGGGVAAARLAKRGAKVCVLERGRELHPGEFPTTPWGGLPFVQARTPFGHIGARNALFDFRMHRDMSVLVGSGLGGTSLINAGVALRARDDVFDRRWPAPLQEPGVLNKFYDAAEAMLGSRSLPLDRNFAKLDALDRVGDSLGVSATRPNLNVTFDAGPNAAGIDQPACTMCGDCVSGCNHGAKNTVLMNYLPYAFTHGASIFTEVEVRSLHRREEHWVVRFRAANSRAADTTTRFVRAKVVVLAAGTLGSTEILLRSREQGLTVSEQLGERFTGNGDVLAFAYDIDRPAHSIGVPIRLGDRTPPGPCIAGIVDVRIDDEPDDYIIEEGVVPSVLSSFMPLGLALGAVLAGRDGRPLGPWLKRIGRELAGTLRGPFAGPTARTLLYLVMSGDDGRGKIVLDDDHAEVRWPDVGERPPITTHNELLRQQTRVLSGTFLPDPIWSTPFGHSVITVQPLGGCAMADCAEKGVVSHCGQVFSAASGDETYQGLYVADGSVVPRPLAANPSLTIAALAERTCDFIINEWGDTWVFNQ